MKLKCQPEDFRVEELPLVSPTGPAVTPFTGSPSAGLGTLEAVELICRRWNIAGRRISYGGLKDRHALTIQYLTIFDGPSAVDRQPGLFARIPGKTRIILIGRHTSWQSV